MATQEKLHKSLEGLKNLSNSNQANDVTRIKEKIQHIHVVTETISNPTIKIAPNFSGVLSITIETFIKLCDDPQSDIRMTAEECLNRIIRAVSDGNIGKVQIELHKEIKKNGAARSLRAALMRFAQLAHLIRPIKGKPYVVNLFPSIIKISERSEELIHETLANSLPKIMKVLGCFSPEHEVKVLIKAFLSNVSSHSAVIRRTTANCILTICMNCRKPYVYLTYCIEVVLDLVLPVTENQQESHVILGVMTCLKMLLPNLNNSYINNEISYGAQKENDLVPIALDKLLQIYELCLHYLSHKDHNVINSSLETLNILLQNCPLELKSALLNPSGVTKSRITNAQCLSLQNIRSTSQLSMATNLTSGDENLLTESELTDTIHSDIERWIDESKLSVMNMTYAKPKDIEKSESLDSNSTLANSSLSNFEFDTTDSRKIMHSYDSGLRISSLGEHLEKFSEHSSGKSSCCADDEKTSGSDDLQEIDIGSFLDKDVPLVYCARFITKSFLLNGNSGSYISDKSVRVSVKSLALSCISSIFCIHPDIFVKYLDASYINAKISNKSVTDQTMSDLLLFSDHPDPQLRGLVRLVVASFIKSVLIQSFGKYDKWLKKNSATEDHLKSFEMEELVKLLVKGLEDESSNCTRHTLTGLSIILNYIAESEKSNCILPLLDSLPTLAKNPYWLVKVALCELVSSISYVTIYYILDNNDFQNKVLYNVLLELLNDSDQRVRSASAKAIVLIIPNLFHKEFKPKETTTTMKAIQHNKSYLSNLCDTHNDTNLNKLHFIENMPFPFKVMSDKGCDCIEFALSKIISKLYISLLTSTSRYLINGCVETLSLLSKSYPCTVYTKSWINFVRTGNEQNCEKTSPDLLSLCVSFLKNSVIVYDLSCQLNILNLSSSLYAGCALSTLRPIPEEENTKCWNMFSNNSMSSLSVQFLDHIVKLLNITHHVVNEIPPIHPQNKTVLANLPTTSNLSPIKRRKSDLDKRILNSGKNVDKDEKADKRENIRFNSAGTFYHCPHYMKIYEVLRSSYTNYKVSLEPETSEKFVDLLRKIINTLSVIMEIGTLREFGRIAEDILNYLRSTFILEPSATVECVQQLLKCLFGTNLTANVIEILKNSSKTNRDDDLEVEELFGFYYNIYQKPYNEMSMCINSFKNINKIDCDGDITLMGYLHRRDIKKPTTLSRSSDRILASYIKIFEPMVIKSLKQYTITSDVKLQCRVLQLLNQLVQLRVNYCLLDSEQVFIDFVLRQFDYIEEGQVPYSNELIPKIFQFLVQLSYSKQHSKSIIDVPKIIQLCDGLMASGQSPLTHCIPALEPIVEDIFLTRCKSNTTDMKELETTREVLLAMLLRLCEYQAVIEFLTLVLEDSKYCTDNTEKWGKWSKQIIGVVFPMLKQNKIKLDDQKAFVSFRKFVFSLNPSVFKPIDGVIIALLQDPPTSENTTELYNRWLSKTLILMLILSTLKEEVLIAKLFELKSNFSPNSIFENIVTVADPLNVTNAADAFHSITPEFIFIRFIFRVVSLVSKKILEIVKTAEAEFLIEQFSNFLMYCLHIFQSGSHCKITNIAISFINKNIPFDDDDPIQLENINKNFYKLGVFYPNLTLEWCYFLTLLNYNNRLFWSNILQNQESVDSSEFKVPKNSCVNLEIVKTGGGIAFCDFLVLSTLHFLAQGSYQKSVGKDSHISLYQTSVSKSIKEVLYILSNNLFPQYVKFPVTESEILEVKRGFIEKFGFPNVLGAIDCTHVAVISPPYDDPHNPGIVYLNRKGYYSINVQASENIVEPEQLLWILDNSVQTLINLCEEAPIFEFISSIHRDLLFSKLFIESIQHRWLHIYDITFKSRVLRCVENAHSSQTGALLIMLLPNMIDCQQMSLSRMVAKLASQKIETMLTMSTEDVQNQLKKEDLLKIITFFVDRNLVKKHETLVSLLSKLSTQCYDLDPWLDFDQMRPVNPDYLKTLCIDKTWYLSQIRVKCKDAKILNEMAELLNHLKYDEIEEFMLSTDFNKLCIKECMHVGVISMKRLHLEEEPVIVRASVDCLLKLVADISCKIPKPHQVFHPVNRTSTASETIYSEKLVDLFKDSKFASLLHSTIPSISYFIDSVSLFPTIKIPEDSFQNIVSFAVVCLESISFHIDKDKHNLNINLIDSALNCANTIFKENNLCGILALETHISWLCSAINSIYKLVNFLLYNEEPLPSIPKYSLSETIEKIETKPAGQACYQLYILVCWLYDIKNCVNVNIPKFLVSPLKNIIVSLSRLPLVNSYILMPARVWKTGWCPELSGTFHTQVPPLPIELLQEVDILEEYIFRITLLGWTSRQQFEETWMCLLSVCNLPFENNEHSDGNDVVNASSLAIKAITSLLLQTLCYPVPGNPILSKLIHVSRSKSISCDTISMKKLKSIQDNIHHSYNVSSHISKNSDLVNVFSQRNLEKICDKYSYGQVSIRYFFINMKVADDCTEIHETGVIWRKRKKMLENSGLDIQSCLQFLLDHYTQLLRLQSFTHLRILYEAVRSIVIISDLFFEKSQFTWMMDIFLELAKTHPVEDELLHQYLIIGICKAAALLTPDLEIFELVKKLLVQYLKSNFLPSRISCLYGLLYILEGCLLSNITIGGISEEMQLILPFTVEYVQQNLNSSNSVLKKSQEHVILVWSLAFYLIENIDEVHMETNFIPNTIQTAFNLLKTLNPTNVVHNLIIKGLERLIILKRKIAESISKQIVKLALDKMKNDNPTVAILGTQLLLSNMYTDCTDHFENSENRSNSQSNPEHLVQTIEKISAIFELIKKGYVFEVEILCSTLPNILDDFFSPADILTKVISEFLSPQQPHPKLLSKVVFKVFQSAISKNQLSLLQDWVVFSLPNFTQSFSIGMATWCLTCFFISASSNEWLRAFFPYVQTRVGRYECEDRKMLCIAGADFYNNLTNDKQKQTFVDNFKKVKDQPDMPFNDLLSSL